MCVQCNNDDSSTHTKTEMPINVERQLPDKTATDKENESLPMSRRMTSACYAFKQLSGMNLFVREARLTMQGKEAKLEYCGFSRPDNVNFRCQMEGDISGNRLEVKGKSYSYGSEIDTRAQITLQNDEGSLLIKLQGGLGDEEIELIKTECTDMEFITD